jgi:hypothetical protein
MNQLIKSEKGFLIRPFVPLTGQRNGYRWNFEVKGLWLDFMHANRKKFGTDVTGKYIRFGYILV